ncbi:helix-turn-helix domain-containing protein [Streptomyces sp. NPDC090499]|uniref:helix-turn-helix domain-containing protein n=1 Tax=Streptomyces sp. NPDC090499 TaxID=3365965 RepID=UPI00380F8559
MTTTKSTRIEATDLSDRAFRVLCQLALYPRGAWVDVPSVADGLKVKPHAVRRALAELRTAGVAERDRRFIRDGDRPTHRTYFRLTNETSEASA